MHVLIVGDGALVHLLLKFALEDAGFGVLEATSGREARELAKSRLDFIFLDVTAFDPEGVELLEELKQQSPESVVILLTHQAERPKERRNPGKPRGATLSPQELN